MGSLADICRPVLFWKRFFFFLSSLSLYKPQTDVRQGRCLTTEVRHLFFYSSQSCVSPPFPHTHTHTHTPLFCTNINDQKKRKGVCLMF